jgi:hypothetical protein
MVTQPLRRGRLSSPRRTSTRVPGVTLEPREPAAGFGLKSNSPGLALVVVGSILLLMKAGM